MKSKTSFFNATVLRKDIARYAPVWGLYTIGLLVLMLIPNIGRSVDNAADSVIRTMSSMSYFQVVYGGLCALMVFGDLFNTRLCYATHAMPLRRESWFLTHLTAGLLFSLVPNLLLTLCLLPVLQRFWFLAFLWLLAATLQFLFFFGAGALSALCAGNRLGAAAIYLIINFGMLLVDMYVESFYEPLLYGVEINLEPLLLLMPASKINALDMVQYATLPFQFQGLVAGDWLYLGILATVGGLCILLAMLVYRKRDLETAGDFLSLPISKPAFLLVYTIAAGYLISILISLPYLGLTIGLIVGFLTGKMLLERTVRIFRGKTFLQLGILLSLLLVSLGMIKLDIGRVCSRVPNTDRIEKIYFYTGNDRHMYQNEDEDLWAVTDPAEMEQFRQFHREVADGRYKHVTENTVTIYVHYALKNGRTILRVYEIPLDSTHSEFAQQQLSRWEAVFRTTDWQAYTAGISEITLELNRKEDYVSQTLTDPAQVQGLLQAVKADCDAGNMAQHWNFHTEDGYSSWLYIYDQDFYDITGASYETYRVYALELRIFESCVHTQAYLDSLALESTPYN